MKDKNILNGIGHFIVIVISCSPDEITSLLFKVTKIKICANNPVLIFLLRGRNYEKRDILKSFSFLLFFKFPTNSLLSPTKLETYNYYYFLQQQLLRPQMEYGFYFFLLNLT